MTETWKVTETKMEKVDGTWKVITVPVATGLSRAEADRLLRRNPNYSASPEAS